VRKDGRPFKPGYDVKAGDVLVLHYARKILTVRILEVPERVTPRIRGEALYEVLSERRSDPPDWLA
jgi:ribosomal 50S subunit-recycling heat shock protein